MCTVWFGIPSVGFAGHLHSPSHCHATWIPCKVSTVVKVKYLIHNRRGPINIIAQILSTRMDVGPSVT